MLKIQCPDNLFQVSDLVSDSIVNHVLWHPTVCDSSCPLLSRPSHSEAACCCWNLKDGGGGNMSKFSSQNIMFQLFQSSPSCKSASQHFTLQTITPIVKLVSPGGAEEWIIFEYVIKCIESVNLLWNNQLCTVLLLLLHSRNLLCSDLLKMLYYSWEGNLMAHINTLTGFRILPTPTTGAPMLSHKLARVNRIKSDNSINAKPKQTTFRNFSIWQINMIHQTNHFGANINVNAAA